MQVITNQEMRELVSIPEAIEAMRACFARAATGAQQKRVRTGMDAVTLSMMGAVLPDAGIAGAKVYTTIEGRFSFVIVLFSTKTGLPLAAIEADAVTGLRTSAATAVAAGRYARLDSRVLSVIGTGVQARAHVHALLHVRRFEEIIVAGIEGQHEFAEAIAREHGVAARVASIDEAAARADVLVTVTRSARPLFDGALLRPGSFVAAVGASKASVRELDDTAIARAAALVVEWKPQAMEEAGDLLQCAPGIVDWDCVIELGAALDGSANYHRQAEDIVIYKAIGIGLEDVALAGLAYRKACL